MGDPVGIARYARDRLHPDGTVMLVEPFALDGRTSNQTGNPMATLLYHACCGYLHAQLIVAGRGTGIGCAGGEGRLREVFEGAGFTRFRRAAETPLNLILEAPP